MKELYPWQQEVWQRLCGLRTRLPHALLLKGPQGIGKRDLGMRYAQAVLCEHPSEDGEACGSCPSCHWFQQDSHPDFRLVQPDALSAAAAAEDGNNESGKKPARQIIVDQIRELADFSNLSSHRGGYRVVLIYPAEAMNGNAANALLKTLEEPQGRLLFILISHKPQHLLPTILSRCHTIAVGIPSSQTSVAWLNQQGIANPDAMLTQAGFAPLLAKQLAEESEFADEYELILQAFSLPDKLDELALAEQLKSRRVEPFKFIQWMQQWCYDLISAKLSQYVRYNQKHFDLILNISERLSLFDLLQLQQDLLQAKREAYHPLEPKLLFESLFISYRQMLRSNSR